MPINADRDHATLHAELQSEGATREGAIGRLHALLLRVTRSEANRRRGRFPEWAFDEVDDLCCQAANDALMNIITKLPDFRGESRFTTWACKFAIFEISTRLRRHAWRGRNVESTEAMTIEVSDNTPSALRAIESRELTTALQHAVRDRLTDRQRMVFQAAAIDEVPIDVLAERAGTSRGAIYKTLHDARRKLRDALIAAGYAEHLS